MAIVDSRIYPNLLRIFTLLLSIKDGVHLYFYCSLINQPRGFQLLTSSRNSFTCLGWRPKVDRLKCQLSHNLLSCLVERWKKVSFWFFFHFFPPPNAPLKNTRFGRFLPFIFVHWFFLSIKFGGNPPKAAVESNNDDSASQSGTSSQNISQLLVRV